MSRFMVAASTAAASTFEKGVRGEGMLAEACSAAATCCPPLELRPEAARQPQPAGGGGGSGGGGVGVGGGSGGGGGGSGECGGC